jgi:hypothetical protein
LVGFEPARRRVDRLSVRGGCVEHPDARQHPGRRDRNELDQQAQAGEGDQRGPELAVPLPVPGEQPDHAADKHGKVQDVVVEVERLHKQWMRQDQPLQTGLAGQVQHALRLPQPGRPAERAVRSQHGKRAGELP